MTPMDDALASVSEGRSHLVVALDIIEKRRDMHDDAEELRVAVGFLAAMLARWECERDRWRC